jgi:hypothetical protein
VIIWLGELCKGTDMALGLNDPSLIVMQVMKGHSRQTNVTTILVELLIKEYNVPLK